MESPSQTSEKGTPGLHKSKANFAGLDPIERKSRMQSMADFESAKSNLMKMEGGIEMARKKRTEELEAKRATIYALQSKAEEHLNTVYERKGEVYEDAFRQNVMKRQEMLKRQKKARIEQQEYLEHIKMTKEEKLAAAQVRIKEARLAQMKKQEGLKAKGDKKIANLAHLHDEET